METRKRDPRIKSKGQPRSHAKKPRHREPIPNLAASRHHFPDANLDAEMQSAGVGLCDREAFRGAIERVLALTPIVQAFFEAPPPVAVRRAAQPASKKLAEVKDALSEPSVLGFYLRGLIAGLSTEEGWSHFVLGIIQDGATHEGLQAHYQEQEAARLHRFLDDLDHFARVLGVIGSITRGRGRKSALTLPPNELARQFLRKRLEEVRSDFGRRQS